jgi:hypothetical protein
MSWPEESKPPPCDGCGRTSSCWRLWAQQRKCCPDCTCMPYEPPAIECTAELGAADLAHVYAAPVLVVNLANVADFLLHPSSSVAWRGALALLAGVPSHRLAAPVVAPAAPAKAAGGIRSRRKAARLSRAVSKRDARRRRIRLARPL